MRAMPPGWWSDKLQVKVSRLSADSPVRVVLDGAVPVDLQIEVFQIPELMLWRALRRLTGQRRPRVATLRVDTSTPHPRVFGAFSEVWSAAPTELLAPARFVAEADGFPTSDPLLVSDTVVIEVEGAQASAGADLSGIPGSPVSVKVDASTG